MAMGSFDWLNLALANISSTYSPATWFQRHSSDQPPLNGRFDWDAITPSSDLSSWHSCFENFQCARLIVPADWTDSSNTNEFVLAVARLPAVVDDHDPTFGGTILMNPGGPGGSGVDILTWDAEAFQQELDGDKHFEFLSWDPRGVGASSPSATCYNNSISRQVSDVKLSAWGMVDLSDEAFNSKWSAAKSFAQGCSTNGEGVFADGSRVHSFVSTALTAGDMVAIIDKRNELHKASRVIVREPESTEGQQPLAEMTRDVDTDPALLNYWGHSYGTYLGNTFASMYPSRIGRMVLDGVVDAPDYAATGWKTNLADTEKTWASFHPYCFEAGTRCPLYKGSDKSAEDIKKRTEAFLEGLKKDPIPILNNGTADIIRYPDVRFQIFQALYFPVHRFPKLAEMLADLMNGNTTSFAGTLATVKDFDDYKPLPGRLNQDRKHNSSWDRPMPIPIKGRSREASMSILCGDGDRVRDRSKAEYKEYMNSLISQSELVGGIWAEILLPCHAWPSELRSADRNRFTGPFTSKLDDYDGQASPLLSIGNTADPVTPLRNAYNMAQGHEGSVVLVQDTPGHCAGPITPNQCTWNIAKEFFTHGKLPEKGTVCAEDRKPWRD